MGINYLLNLSLVWWMLFFTAAASTRNSTKLMRKSSRGLYDIQNTDSSLVEASISILAISVSLQVCCFQTDCHDGLWSYRLWCYVLLCMVELFSCRLHDHSVNMTYSQSSSIYQLWLNMLRWITRKGRWVCSL